MSDGKYDSSSQMLEIENTLNLLDAVEQEASMSQRSLAQKLGVALGLTNALLKRCGRKGLLKFREVPGRRFAYYLTPKGFAEKSRLTAEYLNSSLQFFRHAREEYADAASYCVTRGWKNVALYGSGELCEIAILSLMEAGIRPVAVVDSQSNRQSQLDIPFVRSLEEVSAGVSVDALIITDSRHPQRTFDTLSEQQPERHIVTPRLLRVRRPALPAE